MTFTKEVNYLCLVCTSSTKDSCSNFKWPPRVQRKSTQTTKPKCGPMLTCPLSHPPTQHKLYPQFVPKYLATHWNLATTRLQIQSHPLVIIRFHVASSLTVDSPYTPFMDAEIRRTLFIYGVHFSFEKEAGFVKSRCCFIHWSPRSLWQLSSFIASRSETKFHRSLYCKEDLIESFSF